MEDSSSSKQNKTNEITKEEFDSWATDLLSNKVPDKSAVVKQGVQTLNLVSKKVSEKENISIFVEFKELLRFCTI